MKSTATGLFVTMTICIYGPDKIHFWSQFLIEMVHTELERFTMMQIGFPNGDCEVTFVEGGKK